MPNEENLKKGEPYRFRTGEQQVEAQRKENESTSSLADAIEEAYRNRMEAEKDAEQ